MTNPAHTGLLVYHAPIAAPDVQARYGYSQPVRCMALRHRTARPVAPWLLTLSHPSSPEVLRAGFALTIVQAFAACQGCITLLGPDRVQAFPDTEWKGAL